MRPPWAGYLDYHRSEPPVRKNSKALNIGGIVLAAILGLIVLFALFDWNMARPYINRKVSESTGRRFAISPLAALLPLVNVKKVPDTDCASAIAKAQKRPLAKTPNVKAPAKK